MGSLIGEPRRGDADPGRWAAALSRQWGLLNGSPSPDLKERALAFMDRDTFAPSDGEPSNKVDMDPYGIRRLMGSFGLTGKTISAMTGGEVSDSSVSRWSKEDPDGDPNDWCTRDKHKRATIENAGRLALVFLCAGCAADGRNVATLGTGNGMSTAMGPQAQAAARMWCEGVTHTDPHPFDTEAADERYQLMEIVKLIDQDGCRELKRHAIGILLDETKQTDEELYGMMEYLHDLTGYRYGVN